VTPRPEAKFQKELRRSLEVAEEIPVGDIYVIPVKLDDCEVPESLKKYHWCQSRDSNGYNHLDYHWRTCFLTIRKEKMAESRW